MTYVQKTKRTKKIDWEQVQLDDYEKEISTQSREGLFSSVDDIKNREKSLLEMAQQTHLQKTPMKKISLNRPEDELKLVQISARKEGMKYQPFIKSVVYKYITGQIS